MHVQTTVEDLVVLAKVGTLCEQLPSVLVDPCLYYCCTAHQALAALLSLCTEGCARTVRLMCVGVCNVTREFIWTAATLLYSVCNFGHVFFLMRTVHPQLHLRNTRTQQIVYVSTCWVTMRLNQSVNFISWVKKWYPCSDVKGNVFLPA